MKMTSMERRLFKEAVIREYQLNKEKRERKQPIFNVFARRLRKIAPFNIVIGLTAAIILVNLKGWEDLFYIVLTATIWITLVSSMLSAVLKTK